MSVKLQNCIFCLVIYISLYVNAKSMEELQQKYLNLIIDCSKDYPVTSSDIETLKNKVMPDNESVKCLFACAYKKAGMMDDEGKLSVQRVHEITRKYLSDYPEILRKADEFTNACESVNNIPVSDGVRGCDRAALIFKCSVEKAPEFDFTV